jgi:hypothetical protein
MILIFEIGGTQRSDVIFDDARKNLDTTRDMDVVVPPSSTRSLSLDILPGSVAGSKF